MMLDAMQERPITVLDFDEAMELARTDPEAFEQYRRDIIRILINRAPERNRHRLHRLQWRIDQERKRAANPIDACLKLYRMMIDTFNNARASRGLIDGPPAKAKVLAFRRPARAETRSES